MYGYIFKLPMVLALVPPVVVLLTLLELISGLIKISYIDLRI
jgi:hypothetical protein